MDRYRVVMRCLSGDQTLSWQHCLANKSLISVYPHTNFLGKDIYRYVAEWKENGCLTDRLLEQLWELPQLKEIRSDAQRARDIVDIVMCVNDIIKKPTLWNKPTYHWARNCFQQSNKAIYELLAELGGFYVAPQILGFLLACLEESKLDVSYVTSDGFYKPELVTFASCVNAAQGVVLLARSVGDVTAMVPHYASLVASVWLAQVLQDHYEHYLFTGFTKTMTWHRTASSRLVPVMRKRGLMADVKAWKLAVVGYFAGDGNIEVVNDYLTNGHEHVDLEDVARSVYDFKRLSMGN